LRNQGSVLVQGHHAPIIGANAMDATMIDLTDLPEVRLWDEAVLLGRQQSEEISVHEIARWGQTVSYDILCGWRARLPRLYFEATK
jgi:alanine racemase